MPSGKIPQKFIRLSTNTLGSQTWKEYVKKKIWNKRQNGDTGESRYKLGLVCVTFLK